jgi:hypothetical protein
VDASYRGDEEFMRAFEEARIPCESWNHRAHVRIAYIYLSRMPYPKALELLRERLPLLLAAHQVGEGLTMGYHETLTSAWTRLIHVAMRSYGPYASFEKFCEEHPHLLQKQLLRAFYSRPHIGTEHAKRHFVAPDLAGLPEVDEGL